MTCVQNGAAESLDALGPVSDGPLEPRILAGAQNTAQWLMRVGAADGGRTIAVSVAALAAEEAAEASGAKAETPADPADVAVLKSRLEWRYPFASAEALPSKLTVTGISRAAESADPESVPVERAAGQNSGRRFRVPALDRMERELDGAERGVAQHLVMQYIDFQRTGSAGEIAGEIVRLRAAGFLDERQAEAVPPEDILAFFRSDIGRRVLAADRVSREFRFSLLCPASRWFPAAPEGEEILLQGAVDCCIEESGQLTIVDFKTDARVEPERHIVQLQAYAVAMERILEKPVQGAVLWYLRHKRAVWLPLGKNRGSPEKTVDFFNKT